MPVPTQDYVSYRKLDADQIHSPFFELTAYSYFYTLFLLLSEEAAKDFLYELAQLPDHVWQSLKSTFISSLPGYISLFMASTQSSWHFSRKTILMLHLSLHQIFMAMTFYQAFRYMLEDRVQLNLPGGITTDSLLLNSMLHLYFDSSQGLVISPKFWPITPALNSKASPVTHSLIKLHQRMQAMSLEDCRLSPAEHRTGHIYLAFWCTDNDLSDIEGELELYTDCDPLTSASVNESPDECVISRLQPEILDCLTAALQQGNNPLNSPHACAVYRQRSIAGNNILVHSLSQPDDHINANFLINQNSLET